MKETAVERKRRKVGRKVWRLDPVEGDNMVANYAIRRANYPESCWLVEGPDGEVVVAPLSREAANSCAKAMNLQVARARGLECKLRNLRDLAEDAGDLLGRVMDDAAMPDSLADRIKMWQKSAGHELGWPDE